MFIVNLWLNHRRYAARLFPDGMVGKLSGYDLFGYYIDLFDDGGNGNVNSTSGAPTTTTTTKVIMHGGVALSVEGRTPSANDDGDDDYNYDGGHDDDDGRCHNVDLRNDRNELTKMVWPMGGREEDGSIEALAPLELIQVKKGTGSDVLIMWMDRFVLVRVGA
jgi:hypothetical protein